jgi:hypothetical protein
MILFTLMIDAILSYETSVLPRATQNHIQEEGILLDCSYVLKKKPNLNLSEFGGKR